MKRVFPFFCKHEYLFDENKKMMVYPVTYKGVCKRCGAIITIDEDTYNKYYKRKK